MAACSTAWIWLAGVWVFRYGSLIWNRHSISPIAWSARSTAFTAASACGRIWGAAAASGRGSCWGWSAAAPAAASPTTSRPMLRSEELDIVWRREMISDAYVPRWVKVYTPMATVRAITFTINQAHERYACRLSDDEAAGRDRRCERLSRGPAPTT